MNAREAREIIKKFDIELHSPNYVPNTFTEKKWAEATGYLAALEGPEVKMLIEALEYYRDLDSGKNPINLPPKTIVPVANAVLLYFREAAKNV